MRALLETQKQIASLSPEETNNNAHLASGDFIRWLIAQAREDKWSKKEVGSIVWRENKEEALVISQLDYESQIEVAAWDQEETNKNAQFSSPRFFQWLIAQAKEDKWPKEEVGSIAFKKNTSNILILTTLDDDSKREVATYNKNFTLSALPYMDEDLIRWVHQEASEGRWDQQEILKAIVKEESNGKACFKAKIKPGRTL